MKNISSFLLILILIIGLSAPVRATEPPEDTEPTSEHAETTEYPDNPAMEPDIVSEAAIVMDAATGQVLYEKHSEVGKYPASITKVMTVLITLEQDVDMNDVVTMSENAIWGIERSSTNIGLDVGEQVTVKDLLYATMVKSANECAYALAEYVAGDVEAFADMMNAKAEELGCKHTHFVTPNGLHDDDHYTTAYDMALIMQAAIRNEQFREIAGTLNYTIPATNLTEETRPLWNGNKMINPSEPYYYEYCEGGKTGYTTDANNTLVTFAKKDGLELICVILDCDGIKYTYTDSKALYRYCYNNYMYFYPLSDFSFSTDDSDASDSNYILDNYYDSLNHDLIDLTVDKDYCMLLHKSTDTTKITKDIVLYDTVTDNTLGEINFLYNNEIIGTTPITNSTPSLASRIIQSENAETDTENKNFFQSVFFKILVVMGALIVILGIYWAATSIVQTRKRNERRRRNTSRQNQRKRKRKRRDNDFYF